MGSPSVRCKELFHPVPTTSGLCGAFNAYPLDKMLSHGGTEMDDFRQVFGSSEVENKVFYSSSKLMDVELLLDVHNSDMVSYDSRPGFFDVKIGDHLNVFDLVSKSIKIEPGTKVNILVVPEIFEAHPDIGSVPSDKRKCRYQHEVLGETSSPFKLYSRENCLFEYHLRQVTEKIDCVPWNLKLLVAWKEVRICNGREVSKKPIYMFAIRRVN